MSITIHQRLMCNDDSQSASTHVGVRLIHDFFPGGLPRGFAALEKMGGMGGWSIHPRYRPECARTGEGSLTHGAPREARLPNLTAKAVVVVSRFHQYVLCFSSGVPFNAANGVKIRGQKKQRWLVSSLCGVDIVPYLAHARGEK